MNVVKTIRVILLLGIKKTSLPQTGLQKELSWKWIIETLC